MKVLRLFFFLAIGLVPFAAKAQDGSENALGKYITLSTTHPDGRYAKGEKVQVFAELNNADFSDLRMDVLINGIQVESKPLILQTGKQCIIDTCFDNTTAVIISLYTEKLTPHTLDIGFVVAPEGFRPGYSAPKDLKSYWKKEISAWRKDNPDIYIKEVGLKEEDAEHYSCYQVEISCPQGRPVRGYLAVPKGRADKSLPIVIQSCAAGVVGSWCIATPKGAMELARFGDGALGFMMNAHGMLNDAPQEYYNELANGELRNYSIRSLETRENYYFRTMYLRMVRALDWLCTRPEWDGKRVMTYGESQGGGQAAALAGLDKRVSAVVLNVPALMDLGGIRAGRRSGWPQICENDPDNPANDEVAPYFDTALLLAFSKAEIFTDIGLIDRTCPASAVFSGLNNAKGKVHVVTYPRRPHHQPADKLIAEDFKEKILAKRYEFIDKYLSAIE